MTEYGLLLTALEPISHHDPSTGKGGNTLTFLRIPKIVSYQFEDTPVYQHLIDRICEQHPMHETIQELTSRLTMIEFLNIAFVRVFIDAFNSRDGAGLFEGMARYEMLDKRLEVSSVKSDTLFTLWSQLCNSLNVPLQAMKHDELITTFFTLPPSVQYQMLAVMSRDHRSIVTLARLWHTLNKGLDRQERDEQSSMFAPKMFTAQYDVSSLPELPTQNVLNIPTVSSNSIRHQLVRGPAMLDFFERIGLDPQFPGEGELEIAVENLFDTGSNIKSGTKMIKVPEAEMSKLLAMFGNGGIKEGGSSEAARAFYLASQVRQHYPTLDLLGGVCNAFDLGESRLQVSSWLVCRENRDALPSEIAIRPNAQLSAFDMLTEIIRTHQAYQDQGQMIYNYEALIAGTEVYTRFMLTPFTVKTTEGALLSALEYYIDHNPVIAGQAARGHGHVNVEVLTPFDKKAVSAYREYLDNNWEKLRGWLLDGSLGVGKKWVIK